MAEIKRKRKFNIVDLVLILAIAAIIVAVFFVVNKLLGGNKPAESGADKIQVEFTVLFKEIPDSGTGNLAEGDVIRDANSKAPMGQIAEVFYEPYSELLLLNGEQGGVMAEMEGYTNMLVTVRGEATKDERGYYFGGIKVLVGKPLDVWSPGYSGEGWCVSIREVE